jgi:DNA polymerase III delta prime subunit
MILVLEMHAYLLTGTNQEKIDNYIESLAKNEKASLMEFEVAKISDVRELSKFTNLKVDKKTAILIRGIDQATKEALNAFLKNLEEPQKDLFYILTASSEHNLLPTITSRCHIVRLGAREVSEESRKETEEFLDLDKVDKLVYIKKLRKRDDALSFLEDLIFNTHEMLKDRDQDKKRLAKILKEAERAKEKISAYGNPSLQLTNFVLQVE